MPPIPFTLIRSSRKTTAIEIGPDASVTVRAPYRMSKDAIDRFVLSKAQWIAEKQELMRSRRAAVLTAGETQLLWFLGTPYQIRREKTSQPQFADDATVLLPESWNDERLRAWLKECCRRVVEQRLSVWVPKLGLRPTGLHITEAKTRWGSCSGKNSVSFSRRLIFCPPEVIDYVIVHELCHIRHKNHSAAFWAMAAQYDEQYKAHKAWLRNHAALMELM